jgi:hypothetical protein
LVPGVQSLNANKTHSSFNVHHINNPHPGNATTSHRMAISGNGYLAGGGVNKHTGNFKTSSNQKEPNLRDFQIKNNDNHHHKVYS